MRSSRCMAMCLLILGLVVGCSSSPAPAMGEYVDVRGKVTLANGSPLKSGTIYFEPEGTEGRDQFCDVKDGSFQMKMFVANYKVAFDIETKKTLVPAKYVKFATSGLKAKISAGMESLDFQLKP